MSYLRFGDEGTSRDGEAVVDRAEILGHDGQTTPLFAACAGCQPLDGKDKKKSIKMSTYVYYNWKILTSVKSALKDLDWPRWHKTILTFIWAAIPA